MDTMSYEAGDGGDSGNSGGLWFLVAHRARPPQLERPSRLTAQRSKLSSLVSRSRRRASDAQPSVRPTSPPITQHFAGLNV